MTCYVCDKEVTKGTFLTVKVGKLPVEAFVCGSCAREVA